MEQSGLSADEAGIIASGDEQRLVDEYTTLRDEARLANYRTTAQQYEERRKLIIAAMRVP